MSVDKVILRAILSTLAAIVLLVAFMFVALIGLFPSTMMEITYDLGMEESSIKYAERAYKRGESIKFIAHATTVAIELDDYAKIDAYGEKYVTDEEFPSYCLEIREDAAAAESYRQYVHGQVCVAKYKCGNTAAAVTRAFELNGIAFPEGNAVIAVLLEANSNNDVQTVETIKGKMIALQSAELSEADRGNLIEILALMEK